MIVTVKSSEETRELGNKIAQYLQPGDLLSLHGTLGAGKTVFVKGVGEGLGIAAELITSPTYTLINEYAGKYPIYHFDVYRLDDPSELEDLGYEDYFYGTGATLVEWGNLIEDYMPESYLEIIFEKLGENQRSFKFNAYGIRGTELLSQINKVVKL